MHAPTWRINNRTAQLRTVGLAAELSLAQTAHGLSQVVAGGVRWEAVGLLGLTTASDGQGETTTEPFEGYARGDDLVLACEARQNPSMHVDALWRVVTPEPGEKFMVAIDLIVSVRMTQTDARPELAVQSTLPACETLQLGPGASLRSRPWSLTPMGASAIRPEQGAGCLLFHQPGFPLSYAEMAHPADVCHDQWLPRAPDGEGSRLIHRLFGDTLEKGVLLRGRVRGVFVPRIDDARLAAECYAAFADSEPLLGT